MRQAELRFEIVHTVIKKTSNCDCRRDVVRPVPRIIRHAGHRTQTNIAQPRVIPNQCHDIAGNIESKGLLASKFSRLTQTCGDGVACALSSSKRRWRRWGDTHSRGATARWDHPNALRSGRQSRCGPRQSVAARHPAAFS